MPTVELDPQHWGYEPGEKVDPADHTMHWDDGGLGYFPYDSHWHISGACRKSNVNYVQFDLSGVSGGILSATLKLNGEIWLYPYSWLIPCTSAWGPEPSTAIPSHQGSPYPDMVNFYFPLSGDKDVDVTALVRKWHSGALANYGIAFATQRGVNGKLYSVSLEVVYDDTDPTVEITEPADEETVAGTIDVTADCADDVGLDRALLAVGVEIIDEVDLTGLADEAAFSLDTLTLGNGEHTITVIVYDTAGNHANDSITVTVDNPPVTSDVAAEAFGSSVEVTWAFSDPDGYLQDHYQAQLLEDALPAYDSGEVASALHEHLFLGVANGTYTPRVRCRNSNGEWTEWASGAPVVVAAGGGDIVAPIVDITAPEDSGVVSGTVSIDWTAFDETALASLQVLIDGVVCDTQVLSGTNESGSFAWDSTTWSNGTHTVRVRAFDASGNLGYHQHTITLANPYADQQRTLITTLERLPGLAGIDSTVLRLFEALVWKPPTGDPARDFSCRVMCRATDDPADETDDLSQFRRVPFPGEKTHTPPAAGEYFQWAVLANPVTWIGTYSLAPHTIVRAICQGPEEHQLLILTDGGLAIWEFAGTLPAKLKDIADLGAYPGGTPYPRTLAYVDGLAMFDQADRLRIADLDADERNLDLVVRQDPDQFWWVKGIAPSGDAEVLLAVTNEDGDGSVWRFTWRALTLIGSIDGLAAERVLHLTAGEYVAGAGKLWSLADLETPVFDSAQASTSLLTSRDSELLLGTGAGAKLFSSNPTWGEVIDMPGAEVRGAVEVFGALYAADERPAVWKRDPDSGAWSSALAPDLTEITCLARYVFPDEQESLVVAGHKDNVAMLVIYRLAPDDPSTVRSGPLPPNLAAGVAESERSA